MLVSTGRPPISSSRRDYPRIRTSPRSALTTMAAASSSSTGLLVLSSPDAPELALLQTALPPSFKVIGVGRTMEDFATLTHDDWAGVNVLLNCGILKNAAKRDQIEAVWDMLPNLKWMHLASAGIEHVVFPRLIESEVILTNARGCFSHSLAEFCLFGCKYFALDFPRLQRAKAACSWDPYEVDELRNKTMAVIGFGDIGKSCATLGRAFRMKIAGYKRRKEEAGGPGSSQTGGHEADEMYYGPQGLLEMVQRADYVVVSLPHTPETEKLVSRTVIAAMKPTAVLVNVGRGKTVDEEALVEVLEARKIRGAALDVFATEPLPENSPLWRLDNVMMSPHCADRTSTFQFDAIQLFLDNARRWESQDTLLNVVDKKGGY